MALQFAARATGETTRYDWNPALIAGDFISSATLTVSSGTATVDSYSIEDGDTVRFFVSGGAAAETTAISAVAVTSDGEIIDETIYIPVRSKAALYTNTVRDVCEFALRKIVGIRGTPTSRELDVAVETLNDMLAQWRFNGPDVGITAELTAGTTLTLPETHLSALKYNLAYLLAEEFDRPITPLLAMQARDTKRDLQNALWSLKDMTFEPALLRQQPITRWEDLG